MIQVLCADDNVVALDPLSIESVCQPVLKRFLGITKGFKEPEQDANGLYPFAKKFAISQKKFAACLSFIRSGHVEDIDSLAETFSILGGCEKLDEHCANLRRSKVAREEREHREKEKTERNPMRPVEDTCVLFIWRARNVNWVCGDEWSAMSKIVPLPHQEHTHFVWLRKRIRE